MIETNKNNFFRKRESDFKKRILMKINVSKNMLKNDQRVCMVKQVEPKKLYGFSKMPESNPLAMQTFICTLLSEIVWLRLSSKQTENAVKNLWSCCDKKLLELSSSDALQFRWVLIIKTSFKKHIVIVFPMWFSNLTK